MKASLLTTVMIFMVQIGLSFNAQSSDNTPMIKKIFFEFVDAFNAMDIDTSISYITDDFKVISMPKNEIFLKSKEEVKKHLLKIKESQNLPYVEVLSFIIHKNYVFTVEEKSYSVKGDSFEMAFVYEFEGNKIKTMWAY